jgi:hypothetical protein
MDAIIIRIFWCSHWRGCWSLHFSGDDYLLYNPLCKRTWHKSRVVIVGKYNRQPRTLTNSSDKNKRWISTVIMGKLMKTTLIRKVVHDLSLYNLCKNKDQPNNTKFILWRTHSSIHTPSSSLPPIVLSIRVYVTFGVIEKQNVHSILESIWTWHFFLISPNLINMRWTITHFGLIVVNNLTLNKRRYQEALLGKQDFLINRKGELIKYNFFVTKH